MVISLEGNGQGKGGSARYAVGQRDGDVRALVQEMNGKLQGRGGGRPFFAQWLSAGRAGADPGHFLPEKVSGYYAKRAVIDFMGFII